MCFHTSESATNGCPLAAVPFKGMARVVCVFRISDIHISIGGNGKSTLRNGTSGVDAAHLLPTVCACGVFVQYGCAALVSKDIEVAFVVLLYAKYLEGISREAALPNIFPATAEGLVDDDGEILVGAMDAVRKHKAHFVIAWLVGLRPG